MKIIKGRGYLGSTNQFSVGPVMGQELVRKAQEYLSTGNGSKLIGPNMEAIVSDIQGNGFFFATPQETILYATLTQSGNYNNFTASSGTAAYTRLEVNNKDWAQVPGSGVTYEYSTLYESPDYVVEVWNTHKGMWLWEGVTYKFTLDPDSGRFIPIDLPLQPVVMARVVNDDIDFSTEGQAVVYKNELPFFVEPPGGGTPDEVIIKVQHYWVKFAEKIPQGTNVLVQWMPERGQQEQGAWVIIGADVATESDVIIAEITASPGVDDCGSVSRNPVCLYPARRVANNPAAATQCDDTPWTGIEEEIYLVDITGCDPVTTLKKGDRYLAKRLGIITLGGQDRELYAIRGDKSSTSVKVIEIDYDEEGTPNCETVQTNDGCVYRAIISNNSIGDQCSGQWSAGDPVWAINVAACNQPSSVKRGDRFVGLGLGSLTVGGETRELYAFRHVDGGDQTKIVTVLPYASQPLACQTIDPAAPDCILNGRISSALAFGAPDEFGNECNVQNWTNEDEIWIVNLATCGDKVQIPFGERFIGQYIMDYEHQGATKPLYAIYYRPSSAGSSAIVAVNVIGPESCHPITPNNSCVYPGSLIFNGDDEPDVCQTDNFVEGADIWIVDVASCNDPGSIPNGERFVGHRLGYHTHAGETLPLYGIKHVPANIGVSGAYFDTGFFAAPGQFVDVLPGFETIELFGASGLSIDASFIRNTSGTAIRYAVNAEIFFVFGSAIPGVAECLFASGQVGLGNGSGSTVFTDYRFNDHLDTSLCGGWGDAVLWSHRHACLCSIIQLQPNELVSGFMNGSGGSVRIRGTLTRLA